MQPTASPRVIFFLLPLSCLVLCQGAWDAHMPSQEAFIGWRGETYLVPKPASRQAAAAAAVEPLSADVSTVAANNNGDTATVDELKDIPATAPPTHPTEAPAAPTVAAGQHSIDFSKQPPSYNQYDSADSWVQHLSWHPRLHLYHSFLTEEECDKMRELLARPSGMVGGAESAEDEEASLQLMLRVEQRVANWTALPPNHLEGWQLQHGFISSDAALHTDLLTDRLATEDYQRYRSATVLLFLGDQPTTANADLGGGISSGSGRNWSVVFPLARGGAWRGSALKSEYKGILEQGQQLEQMLKASQTGHRGSPDETLQLQIATASSLGSSSSDGQGFCDGSVQAGLTLTGFQKGSALLIWNMLADGQTPDGSAAHRFCFENQQASAPWIATTWLQNMPYGQDDAIALASVCEDTNPACSLWAAQGLCDDGPEPVKGPGPMIGLRGMCRRSCQDCRNCDSLRPVGPAQAADSKFGTRSEAMPSRKAYMECIYANMHSLRHERTEDARNAGVRKARNAIRRDMRFQATNGVNTGQAAPSQQQRS